MTARLGLTARHALAVAGLGAGLCVPDAASAQRVVDRLEVALIGTVSRPTGNAIFTQTTTTGSVGGTWLGGAIEGRLDRWSLTLTGLLGDLELSGSSADARAAGEQSGILRYQWKPWLSAEASYTARETYDARWHIPGIGGVVRQTLGDSTLQAFGRLALLPFVSVDGWQSPSIGVGSEVGLAVNPRRGPLTVLLSYRFERYSFPGDSTGNTEFEVAQFDQLQLQVRWVVRRPRVRG
ncbi:MAG: hypothetical protein ACREMV_03070 [Gemmatimonadales bacterium]